MVAKQFINTNIPVLKSPDTVDDALILLNDFKTSYLPYVNGTEFEGFFSEDLLLNYDIDFTLTDIQPITTEVLLLENDPLLEAIKKSQIIEPPLLPVINTENQYLGVIEKLELYQRFIESLAINETGGLIEIRIKRQDYSLNEISRIIESESGKIISLFISNTEDGDLIVYLKLDIMQIGTVINALKRFDYNVISYHSDEPVINIEKDRFEQLMKYLSI